LNAPVRILTNSAPTVRPVAKIARVCELLDMDESQVRRLIDGGEIEAHGVGARGVRVFLDSVALYQERKAKIPRNAPVDKAKRRPRISGAGLAAARAAMAELQKEGLV
jgi:hypothetical protein